MQALLQALLGTWGMAAAAVLGKGYMRTVATLLNALASLFAALTWVLARLRRGSYFAAAVAQRVQSMLEDALDSQPLLHQQPDWRGLPDVVARYLEYAAVSPAQQPLKFVSIKQAGQLRFLPGAGGAPAGAVTAWYPVTSEHFVSAPRPGSVFSAVVALGPALHIRGFASSASGKSSTQWQLCSLFRARKMEDPTSMGGSGLSRWLVEGPLHPTSLAPSPWLSWEAVGERCARATVTDGALSCSAVFTFGEEGEVESVRREDGWCGFYSGYARSAKGMQVPHELTAAWELPSGQLFEYAQLHLTELGAWTAQELHPG